MVDLVLGGVYQHYKGKNYLLIDIVRHSETLERLVFYQCLYDNPEGKLWVRPIGMFMESVVVDGISIPRFRYIGDQKGHSRL